MTFSISDFSATINKHGLAKNNLFMAKLTLPPSLIDSMTTMDVQNELPFFCKSVDLPGIDVTTTDVFGQGFGTSEKRAINIQNGTIATVFMVDTNFNILSLFHSWAQHIYNHNMVDGQHKVINTTQRPYELSYKDEYAGILEIDVYSSKHVNLKYTYTFLDVFPTSIGAITTAWENQSEIMTLPIGFSYKSFKTSSTKSGEYNPMLDRDNGIISYTSALNSYGISAQDLPPHNNTQELINNLSKSFIRRHESK